MLYTPVEIDISETYLRKILKEIKGRFCLIGGWATHYLVNKNFESANGRSYIGSRDIDIGFRIDEGWSESEIVRSELVAAIRAMEDMGFSAVGFRLVKNFDFETGRELTSEESVGLPLFQVFSLYVDPVVDYIHPRLRDVLGFVPVDEPLLSLVFEERMGTVVEMFGSDVLLPKPHVLLAMKLNSVVNRDKEQKKIKDIADLFALLWFSDVRLSNLRDDLFSIYSKEKAAATVHSFAKEEIDRVSAAIGVRSVEINRVLAELR